jgi:hypothetical protein
MNSQQYHETFGDSNGIFRMFPIFVPRRFSQAGHACACTPMPIMRTAPNAVLLKSAGSHR